MNVKGGTMSTNSFPTNVASPVSLKKNVGPPSQADPSLTWDWRSRFDGKKHEARDRETSEIQNRLVTDALNYVVDISPANIVTRRSAAWHGMRAEIVRGTKRERIECRFRAPLHLLVVYEQCVRDDGESFVEGLPRSSLRDLKKKLTFVPAGHDYHEWQKPRILGRLAYFYFDPAIMPVHPGTTFTDFAPRLHFEDAVLWDTTFKLKALIESAAVNNQSYLEALGVVLRHELAQLILGTPHVQAPIRGGLAAWQQRVVTAHIEEHLSENISVATLGRLVHLSRYYFCRAFKQSFGIPPHRYHIQCRIERAKALLATRTPSVTDIGLTVGFHETSSFTAAFRKATGVTPTDYHRSLG
jgi:AraC family transcriptional regulator